MKVVKAEVVRSELVFLSPLAPHLRLWVKGEDGSLVRFEVRSSDYTIMVLENGTRDFAIRPDKEQDKEVIS